MKILINLFIINFFFASNILFIDKNSSHFVGNIFVLYKSDNFVYFITHTKTNDSYVYLFDKNGNQIFYKQFEDQPVGLVLCESYNKILIRFENHDDYEVEAYVSRIFNYDTGHEIKLPRTHTNLKLNLSGEFLYSSTLLHDNYSPLDIINLKTDEHYVVPIKDWHFVTSLRKNKLVVLERVFKDWKTELGSNFIIYDMEEKTFIYNQNFTYNLNKAVYLNRDEYNQRTLTVDENNDIFIWGCLKAGKSRRNYHYKIFKLNDTAELLWTVATEWNPNLRRLETNDSTKILLGNDKVLNKHLGEFEKIKNPIRRLKSSLDSRDISKLDSLQFEHMKFDFKNNSIIKSN